MDGHSKSTYLLMSVAALIGFLYPAESAAQFEEPGFRRGFLAMPYIGLHIPVGSSGDAFDPGFRVGTFLGGHINPMFSLKVFSS